MITRPTVTPVMILEAAKTICAQQQWPTTCADDIASEYRYRMDGFDLCKALEKWCSWDTSREDMEALDEMDGLVDEALKKAEREWFEANNIQPPLPVGTPIREGVIAGIYEYGVARYRVKETGCTNDSRFMIIKFEDAVAQGGDA